MKTSFTVYGLAWYDPKEGHIHNCITHYTKEIEAKKEARNMQRRIKRADPKTTKKVFVTYHWVWK